MTWKKSVWRLGGLILCALSCGFPLQFCLPSSSEFVFLCSLSKLPLPRVLSPEAPPGTGKCPQGKRGQKMWSSIVLPPSFKVGSPSSSRLPRLASPSNAFKTFFILCLTKSISLLTESCPAYSQLWPFAYAVSPASKSLSSPVWVKPIFLESHFLKPLVHLSKTLFWTISSGDKTWEEKCSFKTYIT